MCKVIGPCTTDMQRVVYLSESACSPSCAAQWLLFEADRSERVMRISQTGVDLTCHHTTAPTVLRVTGNSRPAAIVLPAMRKTSHQSSSSAFQQAFSHLSESSQKHQDQVVHKCENHWTGPINACSSEGSVVDACGLCCTFDLWRSWNQWLFINAL